MWTKENPSKPGFYWLRKYGLGNGSFYDGPFGRYDGPCVVWVTKMYDGQRLEVELPGDEVAVEISRVSGEWHGPIYPPD